MYVVLAHSLFLGRLRCPHLPPTERAAPARGSGWGTPSGQVSSLCLATVLYWFHGLCVRDCTITLSLFLVHLVQFLFSKVCVCFQMLGLKWEVLCLFNIPWTLSCKTTLTGLWNFCHAHALMSSFTAFRHIQGKIKYTSNIYDHTYAILRR